MSVNLLLLQVINEGDRLLIFTTGDKTFIPHKVGIKRMKNVRFRKHMNFDQSLKERVEERDQIVLNEK